MVTKQYVSGIWMFAFVKEWRSGSLFKSSPNKLSLAVEFVCGSSWIRCMWKLTDARLVHMTVPFSGYYRTGRSKAMPIKFCTFCYHDFLSQGIELDSSNHILFSNRSAAYAKNGEYEAALSDANKVIELQPQWPKVSLEAGKRHPWSCVSNAFASHPVCNFRKLGARFLCQYHYQQANTRHRRFIVLLPSWFSRTFVYFRTKCTSNWFLSDTVLLFYINVYWRRPLVEMITQTYTRTR